MIRFPATSSHLITLPILMFLLSFQVHASSSEAWEAWARTWGGGQEESANSVAVDGNGNIYLAGQSFSFGAGGGDVLLLKYSPSGTLLWQRTWGGPRDDVATGVTVDSSGRFVYVVGETASSPSANGDVLLIKFDSAGDFIWAQSWDLGSREMAAAMAIDPGDGNLVLAGRVRFESVAVDVLLMKVSDSVSTPPQEPVWAKTWGISWDHPGNLTIGPAGTIYVCGVTIPPQSNGIDTYLARYDTSGDLQWLKTWNREINDSGASCTSDASGNIYVGGYSGGWSGPYDAFLLRFDANGALEWAQVWDGGTDLPSFHGGENISEVLLGNDAAVYAMGRTTAFDGAQKDVLYLKYDPSGELLTSKIRRGNGDSIALSAIASGNRNLLAGSAINKSGSWQDLTGTSTPGPSTTVLQNVNAISISLTPTNVVGVVHTPQGTEDTGGGGFDAFVARAPVFVHPIEPWIGSGFGFGDDWTVGNCFTTKGCDPLGRRRFRHVGFDAQASPGDPIRASAGGEVRLTTRISDEFGGAIVVEHDLDGNPNSTADRVTTLYMHVDPLVAEGITVRQGDVIAKVGHLPSPHLHFGFRAAPFDPNDPSAALRGALPPEGTTSCQPCFGKRIQGGLPVFPEEWTNPDTIF